MMNSNDQPPSPGSLDFQPRRANDKAMLSRLANVEKDLAVVKTTVEVIRSNYVTKEDLAIEVGKFSEKIAKVNENTAREFAKINETMAREFSKVNEFTVRETAKTNENTSNLRAEMHREFTLQTWRIIGAMIVICSSMSAAVFYIVRFVR
jgi:hypothetical protein